MTSEVSKLSTGDEWKDLRDGLDGEEVGLFSMDDATVRNGSTIRMGSDQMYFGPAEQVKGDFLVFPSEMVRRLDQEPGFEHETPFYLTPEDANQADFYLGHSFGAPWEFKVDDSYSLDNEEWHLHGGREDYATRNGELVIGMAGPGFEPGEYDAESPDIPEENIVYAVANEQNIVSVPPYVPHRVMEEHGDPDHIVTRYSQENDVVPKYNMAGEQLYGNGYDFRMESVDQGQEEVEAQDAVQL
jgi:hypothetical protein